MIQDYIPVGHENAIRLSEIELRTGMPRRSIRREIEAVNNGGEIVIANLGDGYFICGDGDSAHKRLYIGRELERARTLMRKARAMMGAL